MRDVLLSALEEIRRLQARVRACEDRLKALHGQREPTLRSKRWAYLAKTVAVDGETYPEDGNTFGLIFIDREFTEEQGEQSVTDEARAEEHQAIGRTIDGSFVPVNTVVFAVPSPNPRRWHIVKSAGVETLVAVRHGGVGPMRFDPDDPEQVQAFLARAWLPIEEPEWVTFDESIDCLNEEEEE